jgi:uncharacterized protein YkwD
MIPCGRRCLSLLVGVAGSGVLLLGPGTAPTGGPTTGPSAVPTSSTVAGPAVQLVAQAAPSTSQQRAVIAATNAERRKAGCGALTTTSRLTSAAQDHATDMARNDYFSHTSRDGRTFSDRLRATGLSFRTGGENIARGQRTATEVVQAWMSSAGHRRNILNCAFTRIGVGYDSRGNHWVQDFTG